MATIHAWANYCKQAMISFSLHPQYTIYFLWLLRNYDAIYDEIYKKIYGAIYEVIMRKFMQGLNIMEPYVT